jgi:CubicO group peptidase (beta-lactamase class C family)
MHLLTHQSGVSHLSEMWRDAKLDLAFRPGTDVMYSSNAYGILGDVLEEVAGMTYPELVKEFIGKPVGATSFGARPWFQSPAGQVFSTIDDMAHFAIGVMDGSYVSADLLSEIAFQSYAHSQYGGICLGWYCNNVGSPELTIFHAGSNGRPRAYLRIKPHKGLGVAITGLNEFETGAHDFVDLSIDLMRTLEAE